MLKLVRKHAKAINWVRITLGATFVIALIPPTARESSWLTGGRGEYSYLLNVEPFYWQVCLAAIFVAPLLLALARRVHDSIYYGLAELPLGCFIMTHLSVGHSLFGSLVYWVRPALFASIIYTVLTSLVLAGALVFLSIRIARRWS